MPTLRSREEGPIPTAFSYSAPYFAFLLSGTCPGTQNTIEGRLGKFLPALGMEYGLEIGRLELKPGTNLCNLGEDTPFPNPSKGKDWLFM